MTQPANLRVNTQVPFPAMVQGSGPITVSKLAGLWIVGFAAQLLGIQNPPANPGADLVVMWDPVAKTLILTPLAGLIVSTARLQRSIVGAGNLPIVVGDAILNINSATDLQPIVPAAATRAGVELTFINLSTSVAQTITRTAPDTFNAPGGPVTAWPLLPGQSLTLLPFNDGTNAGYAIV